jgi:predicted nucleic acid binding AN1-type Zn finger protein
MSESKSKKRCQICRKKMDLVEQLVSKCQCGGCFCRSHSRPVLHNCHIDSGADYRKKLESTMVKVESQKMEKI